jgi:hypothetical protein
MKTDSYKCFTYPDSYDEIACNEFIDHFTGFAIHIAIDILKNSGKHFGLDLAKTSAFEALFRAYIFCSKSEITDYLRKKGIIRMMVKRCFWSFATIFGFIPSSGQSYFPTNWVDFKDFFSETTKKSNIYDECDIKFINNLIQLLPARERDIHHLYIAGYDFAEIGRKLGYKNKSSPLKMHQRTIKRIKELISHEEFLNKS